MKWILGWCNHLKIHEERGIIEVEYKGLLGMLSMGMLSMVIRNAWLCINFSRRVKLRV